MNDTPGNNGSANRQVKAAVVAKIIETAARLCGQNRIKEALQALKSNDGIALADARGQCILGVAYNMLGKPQEALEAFDTAVQISPKLPEAHNNRGNILKSLDRLDEALEAYDEALKLRYGYPDAHYNRGHVLMKLDRLDAALGAYDEALKLRPKYPQAHNNRGNVLKALDRLEEALAAYDEALKLHPAHVMARINRGVVLGRLNRPEEALEAYDEALKLEPDNTELHYNRGNLLKQLGRLDDALVAFDEALKLQPDDLKAGNNRATVLGDLGQLDEALGAYDQVLKNDPTFARAHTNRGTLLMEVGRVDEALQAFEQALVNKGSNSIRTLYALSQVPASLINVDILALLDEAVPEDNDSREEFESLRAATRAAELDKAGQHAQVWEHLVAANRRPFAQNKNEYAKKRKVRETVLEWLRSAPAPKPPDDNADGHPVSLHILGPSRSGKSTLEKLVTTLDGVTRGFESSVVLDAFKQAYKALEIPEAAPTDDLQLPVGVAAQWRDCYFAELEKRAPGARLFTNTHPGNIRAVYPMALALGGSRFIFVKRDFNDICLRIYMKMYRSGNAYAYDINTIVEYVTWYHEMIDVLSGLIPEVSRVIQYEDMIANPAAVLRSVAEFCGMNVPQDAELPWLGDDRGCAEPYKEHIPARHA